MYGINIQTMSGKTWRHLFTYVLPVLLFLRFLIRTPLGMLTVLVGVYFYRQCYAEFKPWSPAELALWIDALSGEVKASVLSSLVTVFGFLIAFQVAGESWKIQARGQLKLRLVDEIESFFSEAADLVNDMELFAKHFADAAEKARTGGLNYDAGPQIQRVIERTPEFVAHRTRFSAMAVSVHRLLGSNFYLLGTAPKAVTYMQDAISALAEISERMWVVIPLPGGVDPIYTASKVNVQKLREFVELSDRQTDKFVRASSSVRGLLMASVVEPNVHTFFTMFKDRHKLDEL